MSELYAVLEIDFAYLFVMWFATALHIVSYGSKNIFEGKLSKSQFQLVLEQENPLTADIILACGVTSYDILGSLTANIVAFYKILFYFFRASLFLLFLMHLGGIVYTEYTLEIRIFYLISTIFMATITFLSLRFSSKVVAILKKNIELDMQ